MNQYETGFIIAPSLSEEETSTLIIQMAEVVSTKKGRMIKQDIWGKRRLAYPIKRFQEGFYVFFDYEGSPVVPAELERKFKQTDSILRFMTVRESPEDLMRGKKKEKHGEKAPGPPVSAPAGFKPEIVSEEGK
ncbi:MAG: 30S ribosomal protein S6 [Acidobacteriota bacterium]|nr:30S ribosomal protein S6 [Acidobacteriota bacterium]